MLDDEANERIVERKLWMGTDATLLHEGFYAIVSVLAAGKLGYYCLQSSRLGPLQVGFYGEDGYSDWLLRGVLHPHDHFLLDAHDSHVLPLQRRSGKRFESKGRVPFVSTSPCNLIPSKREG
ncbi:hypothetical protein NPIL_359881 [Nephila pilipes]|uniref:Uncharacterized protein n=1 Tax=Nephila pilipes TaxID=299642 RepID=A0A8X6Q4P4_NEPPI|nr:hypothetical protein NPIL_359881 [Nephila pilipes]